ncbi:a-factor receptor [Aspergillus hancockii]|nr:a-factor receptor [Aspergillus hancockii]
MASITTSLHAQAVVIPFLSILSILLSITPLILHWKNRNFPAISLICWFLCLNFFNVINAFIWPSDDMDTWWSGEGLCDVEVKVMIASYVAVPGCLLCIFRNLACVLDTRRVTIVPNKQQRWWNCGMEWLFCMVVPILAMITHIVYQRNRYLLLGISGCVNSFDESWMSLILAWIWPLVICLIGGYYCGFVLHRLHKYRSQFGDILQSSNNNYNKSRFMRLFFISFIMLLAIIPAQVFVVYKNIKLSLPWHSFSWSVAHGPDWNSVEKIPSQGEVFFDRWFPIISGIMFFFFFGCGRDASRMYRTIFCCLRLDCCFAGTHASSPDASRSTSSSSMNSRVRLLFHKTWHSTPRTHVGSSATTNPSEKSTTDIEKGTVSSSSPQREQSALWLKPPWLYSNRSFSSSGRDRIPPVPDLSLPSNTVSTNAWANTSQSRGSNDFSLMSGREGFIRVKRDISQESETQR